MQNDATNEIGGRLSVLPAGQGDLPAPVAFEGENGHITHSQALSDIPLRDESLASIGALLYTAASPDWFDGFSDLEFKALEENGPGLFQLLERTAVQVGAPSNLSLPEGFSEHFKNQVIPDLRIIRDDLVKREEFRRELKAILSSRNQVSGLYREGGNTYSKVLTRVAGTNRTGRFYD